MWRFAGLAVAVVVLSFGAAAVDGDHSSPVAQAGSGSGFLWGDNTCNGVVDIIDSLALERFIAGLAVPPPTVTDPCFELGEQTLVNGEELTWGNVTCVGDVDVLDSLALKRFVAGLAVPPPAIAEGCPEIGTRFGTKEELPPVTVAVDPFIEVPADIPGVDGVGPARALAVLEDDEGSRTVFVANELTVATSDMNVLNDFLDRWQGTLLKTLDLEKLDIDVPMIHLVRIDPSGVDTANLQEDLRQTNEFAWGSFAVSSEEAHELLAVAAGEAADGMAVDLNWVMQGDTFEQRDIAEAPSGPSGWNPNPYTWTYMNQGSPQDTGVADAWRALEAANKLGNKIEVSILDGGFTPNDDFPAGYTVYGSTGVENPATCTGGSSCPWHGTTVTAAAMGVPDNGYGVAGPAGPIADAIITQSPSSDVLSYIEYILLNIPATAIEGPEVVNISAGTGIASEWCLTGICSLMDGVIIGLRELGMLVFAAAGNDNKNVDENKCIDLIVDTICYERTVWIPCEIADVICVGGLADNATTKHSGSNYGGNDSATVDIFGPYVQWQTPNPASGLKYGSCGTSCATPFVAGVAALIYAADPSLGPDEVEAVLMDTAHTGSGDAKVPRWVDGYAAVVLVLGNEPPELTIEFGSGTIYGDLPAEFRSLVRDPEDLPTYGDPYNGQPAVQWTSSLDGPLGTGPVLSDVLLSFGMHTITATATDSAGAHISDVRTLNVVNDPPAVQIFSPTDGASFYEGQVVQLLATSDDLNYPSGHLDDADLTWYLTPVGSPDDRSNPLGNGHELEVMLLEGDYNIVVVGTDNQAVTATDIVTAIHVGPPPDDLPPTAVIDALDASMACLNPVFVFVFTGHATDQEDGALTGASLVWRLNGTTVLGTGTSIQIPSAQIPIGDSTISLTATDSNAGTGVDVALLHFDGCFARSD